MEILGTYNNALFDGSAVRKAPAETLNNAKNSKNREKIAQAAEDFEAFLSPRPWKPCLKEFPRTECLAAAMPKNIPFAAV